MVTSTVHIKKHGFNYTQGYNFKNSKIKQFYIFDLKPSLNNIFLCLISNGSREKY